MTVVRVADGQAALGAVAAGWRRRFTPLVVGVTGSIAKTSTKEAAAAVLGAARRTLRTEGNMNNEIGLPLTLLRLGPEHEAAVLEMGMYVGGEIAELAAMARPSIGVVTAVQPVHLSRIGSLEAVEQAKGELLEALPGRRHGDPQRGRPDRRADGRPVGGAGAALRLRRDRRGARRRRSTSAGVDGMRFQLRTPAGERPVAIPVLGRLSVHNALAGAAVGLAAGLDLDTIVTALAGGWAAPHRAELVRLRGATIVDDSYNASPGSVAGRPRPARRPARPPGRRARHDARARRWARQRARDRRRGRGPDGRAARRRRPGGVTASWKVPAPPVSTPARIHHVDDVEAALDVLRPRLRDGDAVLVKASRGIGLDRLVDALRLELGEAPAMTVELIQGLLLAFALVVILMPPYIRLLQALGFGKRIRQEGPETHYVKEGTPDDGRPAHRPRRPRHLPVPARAGAGHLRAAGRAGRASALLGAFDDYLNARTGEGIRARQKLIWLTVVAFVAAWQIQRDLRHHGHRRAVRRRRARSSRGCTSCSGRSRSSPPRTA